MNRSIICSAVTMTAAFYAAAVAAADVNQVIISGQSLALGAAGTPSLSHTQPYDALMYEGGLGSWNFDSLVPLAENGNETIASGFANTLNALLVERSLCDAPSHTLALTLSARGGTRIEKLNKAGGDPYNVYWRSAFSAWWMQQMLREQNRSHQVRALLWLQGESNSGDPVADYRDKLIELINDYNDDFAWVLEQQDRVPMFTYQVSEASVFGQPATVEQAQLEASLINPDIHMVTPTYHFPRSDPWHLTNHGYRWLGAYFARAYKAVVIDGSAWSPLRPLFALATGNTVEITFHVPSPPLVLDTETVTDPGNYGFKVRDQGGEVGIQTVEIVARDKLRITLDRPLMRGSASVHYADEAEAFAGSGPVIGMRGNLRDSDPSLGWGAGPHGEAYPLHNWSVIFSMPVATLQ